MIRVVLFDIDGTLIQTGGAGMQAFERTAESAFQLPKGTRNLSFAGRTDSSIVRQFFDRHGIAASMEHFQRFYEAYLVWLDRLVGQTPGYVLPGVEGMLTKCRQQSAAPLLGLLTGNLRRGAEIKLRHYGLWDFFEVGAFGSDHEDRNELALIALERSCRHLGESIRGDEVLVVGDTIWDIQCGRHIGARTLAIASGAYGLEELKAYGPDRAVESWKEIEPEALGLSGA